MGPRALPFMALSLLVIGCGSGGEDIIGQCMDDNPPPALVDAGGGDAGIAAGEPGDDAGGRPPAPSFAGVARECRDGGGLNCEAARFISGEAATCIARVSGLAAGMQPWTVSLAYVPSYRRAVWTVMTVRESTPSGARGEVLVLDAVSGEELERTTYSAYAEPLDIPDARGGVPRRVLSATLLIRTVVAPEGSSKTNCPRRPIALTPCPCPRQIEAPRSLPCPCPPRSSRSPPSPPTSTIRTW